MMNNGVRFTKMHGIGNDYVYIEDFAGAVTSPQALAPRIADRHRGVGGDGLILLLPPDPPGCADVRMRMFNADGSEAEMCGNGIRCVCKYARDHGLTDARPMRVQTGAGVLSLDYECDEAGLVQRVRVDMGRPRFELPALPADGRHLTGAHPAYRLDVDGRAVEATLVSMGNPHAVIFTGDADVDAMIALGPRLEHHPAFPQRVNVHVVVVLDRGEVRMRTWERGSGLTQACGTGAAAVCAAGVETGRTARGILAHLPGGDLALDWDEASGHVFMTGPAVEVFEGVWYGEGATAPTVAG